jgi:hypothetical protein
MSNFQKSFKVSYIKYFMTIDIGKNIDTKMFITIKKFWTFLKIMIKTLRHFKKIFFIMIIHNKIVYL